MFEKVNKAYEYLCSSKKTTDGPDPRNIVLILKAQCILFSRHREGNELHMSRLVGKPTMWFPNRSDTNWAVQAQTMARSLKFRI